MARNVVVVRVVLPRAVATRYLALARRLGVQGGLPELMARSLSIVDDMPHREVMRCLWAEPWDEVPVLQVDGAVDLLADLEEARASAAPR